jgi:gallate decarboxylase subunit D
MGPNDPEGAAPVIIENVGTGRLAAIASAQTCGADLVVTLQGGTRHHVGAAAMAVARPSLADPRQTSSSASVLCVVGHKEDELARDVALRLSAALNCTVVVVAGLHVDDASRDDIRLLLENCDRLVERLIARLSPEGTSAPG